jgi:integrase
VVPNSTLKKRSRKAASDRPKKPYEKFPLTPHPSGKWQKKILGKIVYFGRWGRIRNGKMEHLPYEESWKEALELYKAQADDLHAGRTPRVGKIGEGLTLDELRGRFLTAKSRALDAGEITLRTYQEYKDTTNLLLAVFGKQRFVDDITANDFEALRAEIAKRWGPVRLGNEIQKVRTIFKYGYETGLIDKPIRYGQEFKKPSAGVLRRHRAKNGERMIEAVEIRQMLDAAAVPLKAMILLGVNCGFNNKDCADLPLSALDLDGAWANFPRPKTGIERRCYLWPETVEALKAAIAVRPEPKDEAAGKLVFVTTRGRPWLSRGQANPVSVAARNVMKAAGVHREGIGFATLQHVFRTIADGSRDQVATNYIMGHSDGSMGAVYRERIDDARLEAVAEHVRKWLFGDKV